MKIKSTKHGLLSKSFARFAGSAALAVLLGFGQNSFGQATSPPSGVCGTTHTFMNNNGCQSNYGFHFLKVGMNGWEHPVQCNTSTVYRYWNNLGSVTTLSPGATYTVTMQTASTTYRTGAGAWIDFNQDGNFAANEYIGTNTTGASAPTFTKQFTVPCNAVAGQTLLRFRCNYNDPVGSGAACGTFNYGETMDYIVTISGTSAPSANFSVPDSVYVNSPVRFINSNQTGYVSHEWDVINQGASPDATSINFSTTFPNAGTYQLRLSSTNCQGTATTTKTVDVVTPTSSPSPAFVTSLNSVIYDGVNPLYIDFFDLSTFGPTQWEWIMTPDFLNGAPYFWSSGSQYDQNPSAFFYDVEIYDVCLAVGNSAGWDTLCKNGYIDIKAPGAGSAFSNKMGAQLGSDRDTGLIYDSGGATGDYGNNEYNEFLIAPCGASQVTLTFMSFNLAANDELMVFDGTSATSPLVGSYKGTNLPNTITSTGGNLYLVFLSNNAGVASGFAATWGSVSPNNGAPNADFTVADTVYQCSLGNNVMFENASTGVLPDQASYDWIFDYDPDVTYPTGYADLKDEANAEWPYFNAGTYKVRMVLKSCEGNDTAVKTFVIGTTSNNPIVDFSNSETITKVGSVVQLKDMSVAGCEYQWVITPNTYTIENGGDEYDPIIDVKFTAPGSYNVKLIVSNDNGSTSLEKTNLIDVIEYCSPAVFYPTVADVGINSVTIDNMTNESSSGQIPGYSDYSNSIAIDLTLGATYSFEIARNTNVNGVNRAIWIDFNRDGDFDAGELVASETGSSSLKFSGTFTIPGITDVVAGEARLRVGSSLINTGLSACGPIQVGEYEDYTVNLVPDDVAPIITLIGTDEIVEVNTTYTDAGATAVDNIEGNITSSIVPNVAVDMTQPGVYFVTYNVVDKSGNAAVTVTRKVTVVQDLTKPTITLNGANPVLWSVLYPYVEPGYTAIDQPTGKNVDGQVSVTGSVDENAIGDYTLTYTVYDDFGNKEEVTRTVQVRDTTAPTIESNPVVQVQVNASFVDPVYAMDNFDANVKAVKINGSVVPNAIGSYTQTYVATDFSGNMSAETKVTFEVADYIPPVIHYTPGTEIVKIMVFDNNWMNNINMGVTASDNFYSFADLEIIYPTNYSTDVIGEYTITYKATDNGGNVATFERIVRVVDEERPVIVTNPVNLPRWSTYDFTTGVSVKDNYNTPQQFASEDRGCRVEIIRSNVDFNYPGIYEVCYQAIDESGNRSFITCRTVQVRETGEFLGVENLNMEEMLSIYPNPSNGAFTVKFEGNLASNANITVLNAQGQVIQTIANPVFQNGELAINITGASAGMYIVRVQSGDQIVNKKVTIQ